MRRLIFFVAVLTLANCKNWRNRDPSRHRDHNNPLRHPEEYFYKLAHHTIQTERKFENNCRDGIFHRVHEVHGPDSYTLKFFIPGFEAKDVMVKVMHKSFFVSAERREAAGLKSFWDLKILPDNLKAEEASWSFHDGELKVTFPYRVPLGMENEKIRVCGHINYPVIVVPMKEAPLVEPQPDDSGYHFAIQDGVMVGE